MVSNKTYARVGVCIYCERRADEVPKLGEEHIIPRGLGGGLILPDASCPDCEAKTSGVESDCINKMMSSARAHLGVKGRKSRKAAKKIKSYTVGRRDGVSYVSVEDHPCTILMHRFGPSGLRTWPLKPAYNATQLAIIHLQPEAKEKFATETRMIPFIGVNVSKQARMLAKIAHAYAVAEVGFGNFYPVLPPYILGTAESSQDLLNFVGDWDLPTDASTEKHNISLHRVLMSDQNYYWTVRLRLFAHKPLTPEFEIVVGLA